MRKAVGVFGCRRLFVVRLSGTLSDDAGSAEHPLVMLGFFLESEGVGAARRWHAPDVEAVGRSDHRAHAGHLCAGKRGDDAGGFLTRCRDGVTFRHLAKEVEERHGLDNLEIFVRGVAHEAAHLAARVVQGYALFGEQTLDGLEVEESRLAVVERIAVAEKDKPHHKPEIVGAVRVIKIHRPALWLGRECAHYQYLGPVGNERRPGMALKLYYIVVCHIFITTARRLTVVVNIF